MATAKRNLGPLQQSALCALFHYDPLTGIFTHRKKRGVVAGAASGWKDELGYFHIRVGRRLYLAHRLAWLYVYGKFPELHLDHINGNPSDNRIENLRDASQPQNMWNMKIPSTNKSGFKGVSWDKSRGLWRATIKADGKWKQLGRFADLSDAVSARRAEEQILHGEFARAK